MVENPIPPYFLRSWVAELEDNMSHSDFMHEARFNEMNQYHNCIQGGKYGWKEGAD